jgi:hypothetical protein
MLHAGLTGVAFHALNIAIHTSNAWLTARVARAYQPRWLAVAAGLLVLVQPTNVEAVAWDAGLFDLSATLIVLIAVLHARTFGADPSWRQRGILAGLVVVAVLCKETAVIAPLLILIDGWCRRALTRAHVVDGLAMTAAGMIYGLVRMASAASLTDTALTKYAVQRYVFETFGGLALPWHANLLADSPRAGVLQCLLIVVLIGAFVVGSRHGNRALRAVVGFAAWSLVGTLPAFSLLFIAPDLEGSRYLYLSSVGWAVMLVSLAHPAGSQPGYRRLFAGTVILGLLLLGTYATRFHLVPWEQAASLRDQVQEGARAALSQNPSCRTVTFDDIPESVDGAFVLRNGIQEALGTRLGVVVSDTTGSTADCRFRWDRGRFVRD